MLVLGPIGFTAPLVLLALPLLALLWLILRAVPPAPVRRRFPGVALLLGLRDEEQTTDRTPWWLLLLRMLAIAAAIVGFAGPVLNPEDRVAGDAPLLILMDGGWADASDWPARMNRVEAALEEAQRDGRPAAVVLATDLPPDAEIPLRDGRSWVAQLGGLRPRAWSPSDPADWLGTREGRHDTLWLADGLEYSWRGAVLDLLDGRGDVEIVQGSAPVYGLTPGRLDEGAFELTALRTEAGPESVIRLNAIGPNPAGMTGVLSGVDLSFTAGETTATARLDLPPELRNRVTRFELAGIRSAGGVSLVDDALRRREVAILAGQENREGLQLLDPLHFLRQALDPVTDLIEGSLDEVLLANPDTIILADVARVTDTQETALTDWVEGGGLLVRFAGPRLAASDLARVSEDALMPVRLRAGGQSVGGAMSWGEAKRVQDFPESSPFFGLPVPAEVEVSAQVLAQPDPGLSERTIASLADGTPLVTRKPLGAGQVVLFHVTANAEWSTLPLSGLFVAMLERLAVSSRAAEPGAAELAGTVWSLDQELDGFGLLQEAGTRAGVPGETLAEAAPGPELPPGLYASDARRIALNVLSSNAELRPAVWPASARVSGLGAREERALAGPLLALALGLLSLDVLAALWVSGRLLGPRVALLLVGVLAVSGAPQVQAQQDSAADLEAAARVTLAHVLTGDPTRDRIAAAGLQGLGDMLARRTSVEPALPVAVDPERDELVFYPLLYWPVTADQPIPSDAAYARLNAYLRTGGMILFDTADADIAGSGALTPAGERLQRIAARLDVPPLERVPEDHVLTRTFYLLQDFPGRYARGPVWVEAAPPGQVQAEGMPFRDLNDNVTPVVIGGNDWASAWALDEMGRPLRPVGRGFAGDRQREIAYRFGINLVMYVLTGNYKSDQVHVPALLDRLGN
ncbi:DUF4159 domain-containing protein [Palleronia caenipelagi]|uniref:DUF4159 domain-containing protein n=1 Tax=Palleronia caenipelagi TaxID=2489174 RepID=A0A547Q2H9_9RHOB|nr:DUF4159 domain-containing protein [Palleronia caenipelagi]TRD20596.1 DUF4159 domain-containing protein [Palleronia caenipelagi]